jgi:hypothetical protein
MTDPHHSLPSKTYIDPEGLKTLSYKVPVYESGMLHCWFVLVSNVGAARSLRDACSFMLSNNHNTLHPTRIRRSRP